MKPKLYFTCILLFVSINFFWAQIPQTTFAFTQKANSVTWACEEIAPGITADWTGYDYLVLKMKISTPQLLFVSLITREGTYTQGIQPFSQVLVQFSIPLSYYRQPPPSASDMAATYKKWHPLGMINLGGGPVGALTAVDSIRFSMNRPVNNPVLEVYTAFLSKEDDYKLLEDNYITDSFGQWVADEWPGKIKTHQQLYKDYQQEHHLLNLPLSDAISQYGGFKEMKQESTGFFRTQKVEDRWWFIDPEGYPFLSTGACCIRKTNTTRSTGREFIFEDFPGTQNGYTDYYRRNLEKRYGEHADSLWVNTNIKRMRAWGLNTVGNWSDARMWGVEMPFVPTLQPALGLHNFIMGLADVYDEEYRLSVKRGIKHITDTYKDNPWVLGYFVGNEQPWPGNEVLLCNRILEGRDTPMKKALSAYLEQHGDNPRTKCLFVHTTFDKFLDLVNTTLKTYDPNHLNLGMRFGSEITDELLSIVGKHFDVFSFNCYNIEPNREFMNRIDAVTGLPCLIGEFHFGVPGRGMASGMVSVHSYEDRGKAYSYYVEKGYSHPSLIGTHWFQWVDEPGTGRMDGENYNIGLVDITDRPYPLLIEAVKRTSQRLFKIHQGSSMPTQEKPAYALQ